MKVCAAQLKAITGDIPANIDKHKRFIDVAVSYGVDLIVFPELSLTGYEPTLAKELATTATDSRFETLQHVSVTNNISIGAGVPTNSEEGPSISMILFHPDQQRQIYSKKYLHADEDPFFVSGPNISCLTIREVNIAPAICYELSIPEHSENAFRHNAQVYVASVAKTASGVAKAEDSLSAIAQKYNMVTVMANCVGHCDNFESGGKSAVWSNQGVLLAQLDDINEGILIYDTDNQQVIEKIM